MLLSAGFTLPQLLCSGVIVVTSCLPKDSGRRLHLRSSLRLRLPYMSTNTPNSVAHAATGLGRSPVHSEVMGLLLGPKVTQGSQGHSPWKQSRYSSFCTLPATCMMAMGKLWEEAANTADARDTSLLSRNSARGGVTGHRGQGSERGWVWGGVSHPPGRTASFRSRRTCWCQ